MSDTAAHLGGALLAYMLGITLIITLLPFRFAPPVEWKIMLAGDPRDIIANVVLFLPLGFFYCFARTGGRASALSALIAGAVLSAGIECAQLFESARNATVSDIVANAAGACIGAWAALRVASSERIGGRLVGWLALELPLLGLIYLLVPLLWVNALAAGTELVRAGLAIILGAFGALILGGMQRHYFAFARAARPTTTAALAALWFAAGAAPFLAKHPLELVIGPAVVAAIAWLYGRRPARLDPANRRFEAALLVRTLPLFAIYLVVVICAPLRRGLNVWHAMLSLPPVVSEIEILRLLELVAAFTLVGYIAAEFKGRVHATYRPAALWVFGWGGGLAVLTELVRGYDAASGASLAHGVLLVAAALYGGWLYHLQRAHVRRLLAAR